ncbi:unnamed protein product [Ectocarpus fasciculatus]
MSEPSGGSKPTGGSRRAPRRGFEVYSRRAAEAAKTAAAGGGDGHDTTRGRALWEDEREAARLPKGDKEWKRDRGAKGTRRGGGGGGGGGTAVDPEVPSEDRYEDMSRRVEEEVVAKLARAQMMGMMLKAHREQEQATERRRGGGGGGRRRDGDSGSGGGRRSRGGGGGSGGGTDSAGPRQVLQRPKDSGRQRPGQAAPSPSARGAVVVGRDVRVGAPSQARSGAGAAPRSGGGRGARQHPAGLLKVSPEELLLSEGKSRAASTAAPATRALPGDLGGNPDEMGIEDAYAMVGGIERQHKTLLESLRREVGLVAAGRPGAAQATSGSAAVVEAAAAVASSSRATGGDVLPGAALYGKVSRVRVALSRALGSLVRRDPAFSLRKRLPNRLWMAHYRELEVIQQRVRQLLAGAGGASDTAGAPQQRQKQRQALRSRLFALIDEAERDIGGMVEAVERQQEAAAADSARNKRSAAASPSSSSSSGGDNANADKADAGAASASDDGGSAEGGMAGSVADSDDDDDDEGMTLEERGRQQALQAFLTSLGDLSRYRGLHGGGSDSEGSGKGSKASYARAHELYLRALKVDPSSGKASSRFLGGRL